MKLLVKFNLVFLAVFAIGLTIAGIVSYNLLHRNAREEIIQNARVMMEAALAVRGYTINDIKPLLDPLTAQRFHPQSVPAYAATETFNNLRKKYPEYSYKEATLNPTNPRDRATDWEADIVNEFRKSGDSREIIGVRDTPSGAALYLGHPIQIKNPACLTCHTTPAMAPRTMVKLYGPSNGFGWKQNEIVGAQIVSVPMAVPIEKANAAFQTFMASLIAVFAFIFVALNVMLQIIVVRPVTHLARLADEVSMGKMDAPEFAARGRDEISVLAESFNRMRRSLAKAMTMLGD